MVTEQLDDYKRLQKEGLRLGRAGLSERVDQLVLDFAQKHPDGNYREGIMLAGRLHAIFLATDPHDYWREVAMRGYQSEFYELHRFQPPMEYIPAEPDSWLQRVREALEE